MYSSISVSLEFDESILAQFFRFFWWDLTASCIVILHLTTQKRLLLERSFSQLSVVKNRLELSYLVLILQQLWSKKLKISLTIFDNCVHFKKKKTYFTYISEVVQDI